MHCQMWRRWCRQILSALRSATYISTPPSLCTFNQLLCMYVLSISVHTFNQLICMYFQLVTLYVHFQLVTYFQLVNQLHTFNQCTCISPFLYLCYIHAVTSTRTTQSTVTCLWPPSSSSTTEQSRLALVMNENCVQHVYIPATINGGFLWQIYFQRNVAYLQNERLKGTNLCTYVCHFQHSVSLASGGFIITSSSNKQ